MTKKVLQAVKGQDKKEELTKSPVEISSEDGFINVLKVEEEGMDQAHSSHQVPFPLLFMVIGVVSS